MSNSSIAADDFKDVIANISGKRAITSQGQLLRVMEAVKAGVVSPNDATAHVEFWIDCVQSWIGDDLQKRVGPMIESLQSRKPR